MRIRLVAIAIFSGLVCGCAPPNVPFRALESGGGAHQTRTFRAKDGTLLFAQSWRPAASPRAVLVIQHGLKDHGARYQPLADKLVAAGYAVYALDARGHGRSAGGRVGVEQFADYVDDLQRFVAEVRKQNGGVPLFVFGHSMGGAIVALLATTHGNGISGIILSGPALALDLPPEMLGASQVLGTLFENAPALRLSDDDFTRDPAATEQIKNDPLVYHDPGPAHTAGELAGSMHTFWTRVDALKVPVLLLHGTADKLTSPRGSVALARRLGAQATLHLYPGAYHDLLHDPVHATVEHDIESWLAARVENRAPPVGMTASQGLATLGRKGARAGSTRIGALYERRLSDAAGFDQLAALTVTVDKHIGYYAAGFDSFVGATDDGVAFAAELYPLGVGVSCDSGRAALMGGVGAGRFGDNATLTVQFPIRAVVEWQLGPVRTVAWGRLLWTTRDGSVDTRIGTGDELSAGLGLILGKNRRYWPGTSAAPMLGVSYRNFGDVDFLGVELAFSLFGQSHD